MIFSHCETHPLENSILPKDNNCTQFLLVGLKCFLTYNDRLKLLTATDNCELERTCETRTSAWNKKKFTCYCFISTDEQWRITTHFRDAHARRHLFAGCAHFIRFLKLICWLMVYGVKWQFVKMLRSFGAATTGCLRPFLGNEKTRS